MTCRPFPLIGLCLFLSLPITARGSSLLGIPPTARENLGVEAITGNPYFKRALRASAQLMTTVTIAIPVNSDVTAEINRANLGFSLAGWMLVAQVAIEHDGTSTQILLSYQKRN